MLILPLQKSKFYSLILYSSLTHILNILLKSIFIELDDLVKKFENELVEGESKIIDSFRWVLSFYIGDFRYKYHGQVKNFQKTIRLKLNNL